MFDQNWLKRYMLANQGGAGPPAPGPPLPAQQPVPQPRPLQPALRLPALSEADPGEVDVAPQLAGTPLAPLAPLAAPPLLAPNAAANPLPRALSNAVSEAPSARPSFVEASRRGSVYDARPPPMQAAAPQMPAPAQAAVPPWPPAVPQNGFGAPSPWALQDGSVKHYVVMCRDQVEIRASPTYADEARIGHFLSPGQVVVVDDRRMLQGCWFLHLADGRGWAFEAKDRLLVMTEAHGFERGLWHYSIVCDDDVETRMTPTYSDDMRTGVVLYSGDCIAVDERCSVAGARFLKLADGRGWAFESKDRLVVMAEVKARANEARDFARGLWHYSVVCEDDVEIRAGPTYSDEARTGLMLHPGDCVPVDERCRVGAAWFLRLADGRGWVFETKDSRHVMAQLR